MTTPSTQTYTPTNLTLANGFGCASKAIQNTYAVDPNYRLGHVQVYNVDIQHTFPRGTVVNLSYNGSKGGNLDIVDSPNTTATTVITPNAQAFTYETSVAESRLSQGVISVRKRLERGFAIEAVYQYSHSIDNSSSIGGSTVSQVQNSARLDLEEGNSSFDVRHKLTGDFLYELPFGPNRAFLNQGGVWASILDGFGITGDTTLSTGTYLTPKYTGSAAQLAAGGTYTLRPDRVFSQPINGPHNKALWFNKAAFTAPANGFGTASRNSIEGPGLIIYNMTLSRTFKFGGTRSFEARMVANNVFNIVDYNAIDTTINSATFGEVTNAAGDAADFIHRAVPVLGGRGVTVMIIATRSWIAAGMMLALLNTQMLAAAQNAAAPQTAGQNVGQQNHRRKHHLHPQSVDRHRADERDRARQEDRRSRQGAQGLRLPDL